MARRTGKRAVDRSEEIVGVVALEGEAAAAARGVPVDDGIRQAAGAAHNGDGAIPQGDHLRQAAGLALAGHQEEIGSGVDLPGEGGHKPAGKGHRCISRKNSS